MEDGNVVITKDVKNNTTSLGTLYGERANKLTTNGHDFTGEPSSPPTSAYDQYRSIIDPPGEDKCKKRINPLRIHLGKRPYIDNSHQNQYISLCKKKKPFVTKTSDSGVPINPRAPKLIPKRVNHRQFHNVATHMETNSVNEEDKPVPRLVPKSQITHFKKGKIEKGSQLKEYAQSLGLQPMVKFKCRKCCSMSFKTLAMLKEHQLVCRAQAKEPALSPEAAPCQEQNVGGPSRVTRKVYLCSACGTYYENWNLFLHMREVHNRHICLFCLGMFSKAEKLAAHLINKHNVKEFSYNSKEEFFNLYNGTLYLMCCVCEEICSEQDDLFNHDCNNVKPKPVPVLVSKNTVKMSNIKNMKNINDGPLNGSPVIRQEVKSNTDKKEVIDTRIATPTSLTQKPILETKTPEITNNDIHINSNNSITTKDSRHTIDSRTQLENHGNRISLSPAHDSTNSPDSSKEICPNGDDSIENHRNKSPVDEEYDRRHSINVTGITKPEQTTNTHLDKEREGGIKLKLSLNNVNSPVIINSTVDPTVGQQNAYKPPSRVRRPPKRYEKDKSADQISQLKTPSIRMTICDRADSPFVKTTIYENDTETTMKTLLNNNFESVSKPLEAKLDNTIKTTIYDNKLEEENTLNRVPKLTVRVPKELLDKDSSSDYSSDSDVSDKLTVDENNVTIDESKQEQSLQQQSEQQLNPDTSVSLENIKVEGTNIDETSQELSPNHQVENEPGVDLKVESENQETPIDAIAEEPTIPVTELSLDKPLDRYPLKELLKVFLSLTVYNCIYCNHIRKIAVNCKHLSLHMVAQHRFRATVDSITAEELMPETIITKLKTGADDLKAVYINMDSYDSEEKCDSITYDHIFECFQCYFKTPIHKDLYLHNRKMHQKTILLCVMCKSNFYSYSELLCHLCPGTYDSDYQIKYRCCLCNIDSIPSPFRLMVHLRKIHHTCDVCLEFCHNQARLSNHVWKHKLHHLCYRCHIAYRNKLDITNHLFWKHGTESVLCKRCLQKKWPHVYHFCTPPAVFLCDECNLQFTKAVYLKVHKRLHSEEYPHLCTEAECSEKFISKKLLGKHIDEHRKKLFIEDLNENKLKAPTDAHEPIPVVDLVDDKPQEETGTLEKKSDVATEHLSKKTKKKKSKEKDALLLDVNLPALNLSESDSSDESDSGIPPPVKEEDVDQKDQNPPEEKPEVIKSEELNSTETKPVDSVATVVKEEVKPESLEDEKPNEQQVLEIWDNFKKYQAKVDKHKEKSPPLVPIKKHVCESDHDYCLIPNDMNGDEDMFSIDKKKNKKSPKKSRGGLSSSSSSGSESGSSCSCGSNCSCSSSSGTSSSSSSDSDSSGESGNEKKKPKRIKKILPNRRLSTGSNVDVMGNVETPVLIPEKVEPPIAESDLETEESETDEEFYDENPQQQPIKGQEEKHTSSLTLPPVAQSDGGSVSGDVSRPATPIKEEAEPPKEPVMETELKTKSSSAKKKSKKKKKSRNSKKHGPIKINIPKEVIAKAEVETPLQPLLPNKITISLQSNTVQIPEVPPTSTPGVVTSHTSTSAALTEKKRASKRRRVPNKFYGYSSDEECPPTPSLPTALKPQQPPKLEWRKEDLPSPVTHKVKKEKEVPSTVIPNRLYGYSDAIRLTAPIPDPEPPRILMNTESVESTDSDSSDEANLEIYQPNTPSSAPIPPPTYLNSGTSSLPYAFQRPTVREAREGESVYCYCRCPYDEVSEMIACDAEGCPIEWFHFECVGIMVPPKGKWYCPECRKNQNLSGYR